MTAVGNTLFSDRLVKGGLQSNDFCWIFDRHHGLNVLNVFIESGFGGSQIELYQFFYARKCGFCKTEKNIQVIFLS